SRVRRGFCPANRGRIPDCPQRGFGADALRSGIRCRRRRCRPVGPSIGGERRGTGTLPGTGASPAALLPGATGARGAPCAPEPLRAGGSSMILEQLRADAEHLLRGRETASMYDWRTVHWDVVLTEGGEFQGFVPLTGRSRSGDRGRALAVP